MSLIYCQIPLGCEKRSPFLPHPKRQPLTLRSHLLRGVGHHLLPFSCMNILYNHFNVPSFHIKVFFKKEITAKLKWCNSMSSPSHLPFSNWCLLPSLQITACEKIHNYLPNCQTQVDISDTLAVASPGLSTPLTTLSFLKLLPWPINTIPSSASCSQSTFGDRFPSNAPESNFSPGPGFHHFFVFYQLSLSNLSITIALSTIYWVLPNRISNSDVLATDHHQHIQTDTHKGSSHNKFIVLSK